MLQLPHLWQVPGQSPVPVYIMCSAHTQTSESILCDSRVSSPSGTCCCVSWMYLFLSLESKAMLNQCKNQVNLIRWYFCTLSSTAIKYNVWSSLMWYTTSSIVFFLLPAISENSSSPSEPHLSESGWWGTASGTWTVGTVSRRGTGTTMWCLQFTIWTGFWQLRGTTMFTHTACQVHSVYGFRCICVLINF